MFSRYRYAGFLAILSVILSIPTLALNAIVLFIDNDLVTLASIALSLVSLAVFCLLMGYLKNFMNQYLSLPGLGMLFGVMIASGVMISVVNVVSSLMSDFLHAIIFSFVALAPAILLGVMQIIIGIKLIKIDDVAHVRTYGYLLIVAGALTASVLFSDVSLMAGMACDIFMAMMFFAAAKPNVPTAPLPSPA